MDPLEIEIEVLQPEEITIEVNLNGDTQIITAPPEDISIEVSQSGNTEVIVTPAEEVIISVGGGSINFGSLFGSPTAFRSDYIDATSSYYAWAAVGSLNSAPVWRIALVTYIMGVLEQKYADSGQFTQVWDDRSSLIYA